MSAGHSSRRPRHVTFQNVYMPEVVPPLQVESYDDLVFHVAGLFHTMSFLHEVGREWDQDNHDDDDDDDELTTSRSSDDDRYNHGFYDPDPPLERSVPLMIAEFLYRSAVYLGHEPGEMPWLPGFRQDKRFSGNDVKRWRRLAHFDWDAEERAFRRHHPVSSGLEKPVVKRTLSLESNGHTSVRSTLGASFHGRRRGSCSRSARVESDVVSVTLSVADGAGREWKKDKVKFRSAVSGWIRKHRRLFRHEGKDKTTTTTMTVGGGAADLQDNKAESGQDGNDGTTEKESRKRKPVSWLNPPPVSSSRDLRLLVDIINSCVYCGPFRFRKRDIVRLCNVKI